MLFMFFFFFFQNKIAVDVTCATTRDGGGTLTANTAVAIEPADAIPTGSTAAELALEDYSLSCFCSIFNKVAGTCFIYVKRCPYVNTATPLHAFFRT